MTNLIASHEWQTLKQHRTVMGAMHVRDLFASEPGRFARCAIEAAGLMLDFSRHRASAETIAYLMALARARDLEGWRARMFAGEKTRVSGLIWIFLREQIQGAKLPSGCWQPSGVQP